MMKVIVTLVLSISSAALIGQQQIHVDKDGSKEVIDVETGWTVSDTTGKVLQHQAAAEMNKLCSGVDDPTVRVALHQASAAEWKAVSEVCEHWAEVQPHNHIERLPFAKLISRLMLVAPASSSFKRYRGIELQSQTDSSVYDATILPDDLGYAPFCTVEKEDRHKEGMLYTYQCKVKTESYPSALALRDRLVHALESLDATQEDEVREHGLAANARAKGYCAPTGECLEDHMYVTAMQDLKIVQIEPNPIFTRNTLAEVKAMQFGGHAPTNGIAADSADLSFRVLSVGPPKQAQ